AGLGDPVEPPVRHPAAAEEAADPLPRPPRGKGPFQPPVGSPEQGGVAGLLVQAVEQVGQPGGAVAESGIKSLRILAVALGRDAGEPAAGALPVAPSSGTAGGEQGDGQPGVSGAPGEIALLTFAGR